MLNRLSGQSGSASERAGEDASGQASKRVGE